MQDIAVARRLATQIWGPVSRQMKMGEGMWWIECQDKGGPLQGGYIVDVNKYPDFKPFVHVVYDGNKKGEDTANKTTTQSEQHFAVMSGVAGMSLVAWLYPHVITKMYSFIKRPIDLETFKKAEWAKVQKAMNENKGLLQQYPKHGNIA